MSFFFYHLVVELAGENPDHCRRPLLPPSDVDIFNSSLPVHRTSNWAAYRTPRHHKRSKTGEDGVKNRKAARPRSLTPSKRPSEEIAHARDLDKRLERVKVGKPKNPESASKQTYSCEDDYRFDQVTLESINMESYTLTALEQEQIAEATHASLDNAKSFVQGLKGRYIPSDPATTELGWGVVHLYREEHESPSLENTLSADNRNTSSLKETEPATGLMKNDCTTLCILAVPSYMTPSDLLGWLGEETMEMVSHFRLVRTGRSNRYMVLIKFRESLPAIRWQRAWNSKLFSSMEPENCHIVFVKSIRFDLPSASKDTASFPDMTNDPFTPSVAQVATLENSSNASSEDATSSITAKPAPPPTPALVELPTCPVCLERMDETTGLATIFCQHVFHCACLQKWQGSGCPVCRYTQDDPLHRLRRGHERVQEDQCRICGISDSLWICLVCGQVGCGRYDEAHAYAHFEESGHAFAMDIKTQAIWDYANDEWVHRLIQNKLDGKLVELPSAASVGSGADLFMTKDKLEDVSMEYTSLLKGQLDSQRSYFEEQVDRAVDKASEAALAADEATAKAIKASEQLDSMQAAHQMLLNETLPGLEKAKDKAERRAEKFEVMARTMEKEWKEKEVINDSLMDRIKYLETRVDEMTVKNSDLEEQNRDLSFFISGTQRLKDQGEDVQEGMVEVGKAPTPGAAKKKKGKGKAQR